MTAIAQKPNEFEAIRYLMGRGYGWEDICVLLKIGDKRAVRKIVIG